MGRRSFREALKADYAGIRFTCPDSAPHDGFARAFSNRFAHSPDYTARYGYESARLLVAAARKAGLNRARIRNAVRGLSPWEGVAATIVWDPLGRNLLLPVDSAICTIAGETLTFREPQ
jgi:ABC-type branched-subunit amino acid transport system substrate-binding protein